MKCDACGFDMGNSLGESGKCGGCGTPLGPPDDHEVSCPGYTIHPDRHEPYIIDSEDRKWYSNMGGVVVIRKKIIKWGRGIGAETYGYYVKDAEEVVSLPEWSDDHDECPECGNRRAVREYGFDGCVAGYSRLNCESCDYEFYEQFYC